VETDAIDDAIQQLQADLDAERRERLKLRTDFDLLSSKLRTPGTKFLVDLEYRLVYDATQTVADATLSTPVLIETLPGTLHAIYEVSAYCTDSNTPVILCDGTSSVSPAAAIAVMLQRQRATSPTRIAVSVLIRNDSGASRSVAVRVWRRLGMGS
jgi:hypothetical protein